MLHILHNIIMLCIQHNYEFDIRTSEKPITKHLHNQIEPATEYVRNVLSGDRTDLARELTQRKG